MNHIALMCYLQLKTCIYSNNFSDIYKKRTLNYIYKKKHKKAMNVQLIELYFRDESQINDAWINL